MRNLLIVLILMIMPLFVNAQIDYSMQSPLPIHDTSGMPMQRPNTPKLETVKPLSRTRVENAQAKLEREEHKLIKLARKAWDQEDDLKKEQEQLKDLENTPEKNNNPENQKNIENLKKQIAKSQDKVNKAKAEVEARSKKIWELEKAIDEAKFTRHD